MQINCAAEKEERALVKMLCNADADADADADAGQR